MNSLCGDHRVRKISFTGSFEVGAKICQAAGMKRVTMELGSNSPLIVMDDADLSKVINATVATGYGNAGQVCISTQRVLVDRAVYADFLAGLKPKVEAITTGSPLADATKMGPMIRRGDADRVTDWFREAVAAGARLVTGGEQAGTIVQPTILADVHPQMRVFREELFGPAVAVSAFDDVDAAIALANDSRYGLSAGIFTENLGRAMKFIRHVHSGNLHVNWGPAWRADLMPYGGLKDSGLGKEGPAFAIEEMTERKMVVFHL
jgi:glyceraldehyde-3-phosphate dehydrogenase (NADP+)